MVELTSFTRDEIWAAMISVPLFALRDATDGDARLTVWEFTRDLGAVAHAHMMEVAPREAAHREAPYDEG